MTPRPVMTRQELHRLVWAKSLEDVAVDLQMSAAGLRKVCRRHGIPVPSTSHWDKADRPPPAPLPPHGGSQYVPFNATSRKLPSDLAAKREAAKAALVGGPSPKKPTHPYVAATAAALAAAIPDRRGALTVGGAGVAGVSVSPESVDRSLAVLEGIIRRTEALGYAVVAQSSSARLQIDGVPVPFLIAEGFLRSDTPPDADEEERRCRFQERYSLQVANYGFVNPWMYRPSGKLSVSIGFGPMDGLRSKFTDIRLAKVEQRADEILAEAVAHAALHKAVREKVDIQQAQRVAEREVQRLDERDGERQKFVSEKAGQLQRLAQLDAFVRHLQAASPPPHSGAAECLRWAEEHLDDRKASLGLSGIEQAVQASGLWRQPA